MEEQIHMNESPMNKKNAKSKRKHNGLKIFLSIICVLLALFITLWFIITCNTQIIVGMIQKIAYSDMPINSYEPFYNPIDGKKENGQYLISEIKYDTEYPNSYLDIIYPDENKEADRPTLVYFHGGGFFSGSKNMGDPLAATESTFLLDDICAAGYNIVNVDYALVPEHHFPVPLIQVNRAIRFIQDHKDEYHLNTDKIILMGSSAGAIMVAQYGAVISNPDYASLLGIIPCVSTQQISAVVVDDGPVDYNIMPLACKLLIGNYVKGSIYLSENEKNRYNCIPHITKNYPNAFLLGSEYRNDMINMHKQLDKVGVENTIVDPYAEHGVTKPHCFVASERVDPISREAFDKMIAFMNEITK